MPPESGRSPGQTGESPRPSQPQHARRQGGERHRGRAASVTVCRAARADGVDPLLNPRGSEQVRRPSAPHATPPSTAVQRAPACRAPPPRARRTHLSVECKSIDAHDARCAQELAAGAKGHRGLTAVGVGASIEPREGKLRALGRVPPLGLFWPWRAPARCPLPAYRHRALLP